MIIAKANRLNEVGEYYFSTKLAELQTMREQGHDVINLGIGKPDLPPPAKAITALTSAANHDSKHGYQSYRGTPELRNAIAKWMNLTYVVAVDSTSEVLPLMGSKEGIMHISLAFLNPGDGVLVPNPGYPTYGNVSKLVGANLIPYNLEENNNWLPDLEKIEQQDLSKVKIMWVNYPNMPTGARGSKSFFSSLVRFAKTHNILIVNDNPYSTILNQEPQSILAIEGAKEVAIELGSMSKTHNMSGWRVGWLAGYKLYIDAVLALKSNMDSGMLLPVQEGAIAALAETNAWNNTLNAVYADRRKIALTILSQLECSVDINQVGMFLWAKVSDRFKNGKELSDHLLKSHQVFITPGFIFGANGELFVRISLCTPAEILEKVVLRLRTFALPKTRSI